jgi:integrase
VLTLYRRHLKSCEHRAEGRKYRRCRCPIWVDGQLGGREIARSLRLRDWQKANQLIQDWEARNEQTQPSVVEPITLPQAWDTFLRDAEARNLREPSLRKYRYLRKEMEKFAANRGTRYIKQFDLETLLAFRASWSNQNLSALKKLEMVRCFFRFAHDNGWVPENYARKIRPPKVTTPPTLPFEREEVVRILAATDTYPASPETCRKLRALVLLLLYLRRAAEAR